MPNARRFATLLSIAAMLVATAPASAQFYHRHNDGTLSINPLLCQTDYQIRQIFAQRGYTDIKLNAPIESTIRVHANKGRVAYEIDYDFCSGRTYSIEALGRAR